MSVSGPNKPLNPASVVTSDQPSKQATGSFAHQPVEKVETPSVPLSKTKPTENLQNQRPVSHRQVLKSSPSELTPEFRRELWQELPNFPHDAEFCRQLIIDSALAEYTYNLRLDLIAQPATMDLGTPSGRQGIGKSFEPLEQINPEKFQSFRSNMENLPVFKGRTLKVDNGLIYDRKSGLVMTLFVDDKFKQVKLVFGGTFSGKLLSQDTRKLSLQQVFADGKNFTGLGIPMAYQQAEAATGLAKSLFSDETLTLTGHSLGGGLAQYSGCMHEVPANCFASAALGKAPLVELMKRGKLNPEWIKKNIFQVLVMLDPVNNPKGTAKLRLHFVLTNLGTRFLLPSNDTLREGSIGGYHSCSHGHVTYYATRSMNKSVVESRL